MALAPVQTLSFIAPAGRGTQLLEFEQFDPALGALGGVRTEISAQVDGLLLVENMEGRAVSLGYVASGKVSLSVGAEALTSEAVEAEQIVTLAAFDGGVDYSGASGMFIPVSARVDGVAPAEATGTVSTAPFIGTGTVGLTVASQAANRIAGPANMRVQAAASLGGEVRLAYDYTPGPGTEDNGGGGGSSVVITYPLVDFGAGVTVTTAPQVFRRDTGPTGWQETLAVGRFDPALGTLIAVHVRMVSTMTATAWAENQGAAPAVVTVAQEAQTALFLDGIGLLSSRAQVERSLALGAGDGVDDFAGSGGMGEAGWAFHRGQALTMTSDAARAAFSGTGTVTMTLDSIGSGVISGPESFLAEIAALSGAVVEVAYTYLVEASAAAVVVDGSGAMAGAAYGGPVPLLQREFISITPENVVVAAASDNWFIRTGDGDDAIAARGGTNVIDGGGGSNFLTGGFGLDTFFVDLRPGLVPSWSTIANFQPGDAVTLWGVTAGGMPMAWSEDEGAVGATGLTLHITVPGQPAAAMTLSGYDAGDITNGALDIRFGTIEGNDYMWIRAI